MKKSSKRILICSFVFVFVMVVVYCIGVGTNKIKITSDPGSDVKVSVVIPVYNTEEYLDECLNSVENQTLKDIEIICVNDGSTGSVMDILKKHQKSDDRIKIIEQENSGVSAARNRGIIAARGDYIAFLDSDDYVASYAYEKAYKDAVNNNADVVQFGKLDFGFDKKINLKDYSYDDSLIKSYSRKDKENPFKALKLNTDSVLDKLWKHSFLMDNKISFKQGLSFGEDNLFGCISAQFIHKLVADENVLYFRRVNRPGSAMQINNEVIEKKVDNYLVIISELVSNRNNMTFDGSDDFILSLTINLCYDDICGLENSENQKYYAQKLVSIVEDEFLNKYGITASDSQKEKLNVLKSLI